MKKRKKIKSKKKSPAVKTKAPKANADGVYNNLQDFILEKFWNDIVQSKPKKITPTMVLSDLVPDARFKTEFLEMYVDRTELILGMSIRRIKAKPIIEIIKFLTDLKQKKIMFGWK